MGGIADEEKTDLVFAIDQPASVPASEDEMAKQIIRQMMKSLQSQTSGTEDKDMIELVNGINQQMTNILRAQMSGVADKGLLAATTTVQDNDECIKAGPLSKDTLEKVKNIARRAEDDEKAKEIMRLISEYA